VRVRRRGGSLGEGGDKGGGGREKGLEVRDGAG
jgi:hypothetical protein